MEYCKAHRLQINTTTVFPSFPRDNANCGFPSREKKKILGCVFPRVDFFAPKDKASDGDGQAEPKQNGNLATMSSTARKKTTKTTAAGRAAGVGISRDAKKGGLKTLGGGGGLGIGGGLGGLSLNMR